MWNLLKCLPTSVTTHRHLRLQKFPTSSQPFSAIHIENANDIKRHCPKRNISSVIFLEPSHNWNNSGISWKRRGWTGTYLVWITVFQIFRQSLVWVREDMLKVLWAQDSWRHPYSNVQSLSAGRQETWSPGKVPYSPFQPSTKCCSTILLLTLWPHLIIKAFYCQVGILSISTQAPMKNNVAWHAMELKVSGMKIETQKLA